MSGRWLRVIADDLTGACDVGAALLPAPRRVVVASRDAPDDGALVVRNTQSRTCAPAEAAARVRAALADAPRDAPGQVLKKIDTGLRGPLGAELDAALEACGAAQALVLPVIPEMGRTTVGGVQLVDGVPVDRTAFARDPQNPVREARVAHAIAATTRRRVRSIGLDALRAEGAAAVLERARRDGIEIVVGDAETDADLAAWLDGLPDAPVVLAGSTGLARAWRARAGWDGTAAPVRPASAAGAHGILVVAGSAHPVGRAQVAYAAARDGAIVVDAGEDAAPALRAGRTVCLLTPDGPQPGGSAAVLERLAAAAARLVGAVPPRAIVLVGGETAHAVLGVLGHPRLGIDGAPAPLAVRATVLDGALAGTPLVTKGGSSGPPERLSELIAEVGR